MTSRELTAPAPQTGDGEGTVRGGPAATPASRARQERWRLPADRPGRHLAPLGLVAIAVGFNLWILRAELMPMLQVNDGGMHLSMVRTALERIQEGHLPFDAWYAYLGFGSSWFHHYQSLPAIVTGTLGLAIGPDRAFSTTLYVLLATWPISVYIGARLLGWERWAAAGAAVLSPLLASTARGGFGYELHSYVWRGPGLWTQLWAMWLLPLAWGSTWRTVSGRAPARYATSALLIAFTAATHFLTAYLALLALGVWVLIRPSELWRRAARAAALGAGALLIISWVVVPAILDARYVNLSAFWHDVQSKFFDSYGAPRVLKWFVTGQLFDAGRLPVITVFVALGIAVCVARSRRDERARALLGVLVLSLVLYSGRPTFGALIDLLPGGEGLFLHRYIAGVHLAGVLLAGVGVAWVVSAFREALRRQAKNVTPALATAVIVVLGVGILSPAWAERWKFAHVGSIWMYEQRAFDDTEGAAIRELITRSEANGPGRIYSGLTTNWGRRTRMEHVPLYLALLGYGADGIGFLLHTNSLSSDFEYEFDDTDPDQYELFGVRYLILPVDEEPPVPANAIEERRGYVLWEIGSNGYLDVVDTVAPAIEADQVTLHDQAVFFLRSHLLENDRYPTIAFAGSPAAEPSLEPGSEVTGSAGTVRSERVDLGDGVFVAEVDARRQAVVILRSTFDPRWEVTVDGNVVEPQMLAPSFVGAPVPPGRHTVAFRYRPFPRYDVLFAIGVVAVLGLWIVSAFVIDPRTRRRRAQDDLMRMYGRVPGAGRRQNPHSPERRSSWWSVWHGPGNRCRRSGRDGVASRETPGNQAKRRLPSRSMDCQDSWRSKTARSESRSLDRCKGSIWRPRMLSRIVGPGAF